MSHRPKPCAAPYRPATPHISPAFRASASNRADKIILELKAELKSQTAESSAQRRSRRALASQISRLWTHNWVATHWKQSATKSPTSASASKRHSRFWGNNMIDSTLGKIKKLIPTRIFNFLRTGISHHARIRGSAPRRLPFQETHGHRSDRHEGKS